MGNQTTKKSLSNIVYEDLKTKILNNDLLPGNKLIEIDIAKDLNVSRTPVREALSKLSKENLVESHPRKSYIVSKFSLKDARELYDVRAALEPLAVKEICDEGITKRTEDLELIALEMQSNLKQKDITSTKANVIDWNLKLIELTKNKFLREMLSFINSKLYRFASFIVNDEENLFEICSSIKVILDNIKAQNCKSAYNSSLKYVSSIYPMLEKKSNYKMFKNY